MEAETVQTRRDHCHFRAISNTAVLSPPNAGVRRPLCWPRPFLRRVRQAETTSNRALYFRRKLRSRRVVYGLRWANALSLNREEGASSHQRPVNADSIRSPQALLAIIAVVVTFAGCGSSGGSQALESRLNAVPGVRVHCISTGDGDYRCPGTDKGRPATGEGKYAGGYFESDRR